MMPCNDVMLESASFMRIYTYRVPIIQDSNRLKSYYLRDIDSALFISCAFMSIFLCSPCSKPVSTFPKYAQEHRRRTDRNRVNEAIPSRHTTRRISLRQGENRLDRSPLPGSHRCTNQFEPCGNKKGPQVYHRGAALKKINEKNAE